MACETIAEIDPDDFTDFTVSRPEVRVEAGVPGDLRWPRTELGWCTPDRSLSVVTVRGPEPQFRWGSFCEALVDAADELGCSTVVTLGAMLSEVPHTRPVPVFTAAHDLAVADALGLPTSDYVGPTGIPSALAQAAHRRGLESLGLWAALPGYAAGVASPVGTLALVEQAAAVLGVGVEARDLADAAGEYVEHLDALVDEDEETSAYLLRLERAYDEDAVALGSADDLVSEVESFLRDQS